MISTPIATSKCKGWHASIQSDPSTISYSTSTKEDDIEKDSADM